jgi:hypothetical protein
MSVEVVKLTTGEEIISDLEVKEDVVEMTNAMLVAVNDGRLVFIPYMQYTSAAKFVTIDKKHVMFVVTPVDSLIDDYNNATTKVTKPRKSIVSSVP